MAVDLSTTARSNLGSVTRSATLDATANDATAITLPAWCVSFDIFIKKADDATDDSGKLATSGTDSAAIGTHYFPIPSGQGLTVNLPHANTADTHTIYVSGATGADLAKFVLRDFRGS